ncbi:MAG TPA: YhcH/YjgK/YiaL family protein [Marinilabiliales bacterium]|jgi:YhcH/YjgK/YiaL family protein|nr:MAG: hypothetical protein A2W95_03905 [Bacteroidetes bacterium GWA2_40_14]OFX60978.1 MAG: hypothetical protein A2W84_18355 [Bacteroidetes bacterium GWC2_40_13]OFX76168.1 MAG: hypothetical protein A2W96_00260 [Bacteroidetes bacterium GWD2_40_43]OFX95383.1 MAG: hypothetical protein A2W97_07425 [Bacteroidetes bacterium GWE2_40_63]OFY19046.1 MAG: hypothetical protein A2W88_03910 [Bacteroidetes bacterium GWF2_40_13]OFZ23972.1 MAG: hypothetical protein A2437_06015 [Bacteroidetes bacterium RIFOXYC
MILDHVKNIERYRTLSANLAKAIDFITANDLARFVAGKHLIDGEQVFLLMNEYETKPEADCKTETHRKYIDIQLMLSGAEKVGYAFLENQKVVEGYNVEKDYTFYEAELDYFILKPQWFAIFFPTDMHCPSIKAEQPGFVCKAVVKVKVA